MLLLLEDRFVAPGANIELGGLSISGTIGITKDDNLSFSEGIARSDVNLNTSAVVDVRAGGGGFIGVNARNLTMSEQSQLIAGIAENKGSPEAQAGNIALDATESVKVLGSNSEPAQPSFDTEIYNHVGLNPERRDNPESNSNAQGNGGAINIKTDLLEVKNRGRITAINYSDGNSGDVFVDANNVLLEKGSVLSSEINDGKGNAGDVTINSTESLVLDNSGTEDLNLITSQITGEGEGNAGDIKIDTGSLLLKERSFILADNQGKGNAGNITIDATGSVALDATQSISADGSAFATLIISQVQNDVVGNGGDINISSPIISLANFSLISTNAKQGSVGQAGNINLNANTINLTNGSVIDALTENDFDGGDININANFLGLSNGGKIVTGNDRGGSAGNINLNISGDIVLRNGNPPDNSPFFEQILQNLTFETGIFANNFPGSIGNGGNIFIAADSIKFQDRGSILAETVSGEGGNITLQAKDLISLRQDSLISAEAIGTTGNGGNINIDTNFVVAFPNQNSDIVASTAEGRGGDIDITTKAIFGLEERSSIPDNNTNDIDASSEFGLDGTVEINELDVNPAEGLEELPVEVIDVTGLVAQNLCQQGQGSEFVVTGKGRYRS